jgi:hypothetical protein
MEQVVGEIFQYSFDLRAGHLVHRRVRIGDGRLVHQVLEGDGFPRQERGAPAKPGRERDLRVLLGKQCLEDELVERAVEISAAVKHALGDRQLLAQLFLERPARP